MSVYDKPDDVAKTVESVLSQQSVKLELLIVSDGASEDVLSVLHGVSDPRVRFIEQTNQGLTAALINGCEQAQYDFIARIDAGDCMLPQRLHEQAVCLQQNANVGLVSCWVQIHTEDGFDLYTIQQSDAELMAGLRSDSVNNFRAPHHASVMFRKAAYIQAGGYRKEFYFAQDCDLWSRMMEAVEVEVVQKLLQRCVFSASGISGRHRDFQVALSGLVVEAARLRTQGQSDQPVLMHAAKLRPSDDSRLNNSGGEFDGNYFIASVLSKTQPKAALTYLSKALAERPWHWRARIKQILCLAKGLL